MEEPRGDADSKTHASKWDVADTSSEGSNCQAQASVQCFLLTCNMKEHFKDELRNSIKQMTFSYDMTWFEPGEEMRSLKDQLTSFSNDRKRAEKHLFMFGHYHLSSIWLAPEGGAENEKVELFGKDWEDILVSFCSGDRQFVWITGCDGANADMAFRQYEAMRQREEDACTDRKTFIRRFGSEVEVKNSDGSISRPGQGSISTSAICKVLETKVEKASDPKDLVLPVVVETEMDDSAAMWLKSLRDEVKKKYKAVLKDFRRQKSIELEVDLRNDNLLVITFHDYDNQFQVHGHYSKVGESLKQTGDGLYVKDLPRSMGKHSHVIVEKGSIKGAPDSIPFNDSFLKYLYARIKEVYPHFEKY